MQVREFIAGFIGDHEGALSVDPKDAGNWFSAARYKAGQRQVRGSGALIGSKYGITGGALADFYRDPFKATAEAIKSLTFDQAVTIAVELYAMRPGYGRLAWNRVTAAVVDFGFNAGPGTATKALQQMIGADADGAIGAGGETVRKFAAYVAAIGEEAAMAEYCRRREAYYAKVATNEGPNDPDQRYLKGWINRARSFLSGSKWWKLW